MSVWLDHIVIGARNRRSGIEDIAQALGVQMPLGGEHTLMGTHNALMQVGRGAYAEIIAIDDDARAPGRARWYGLDDQKVQSRFAEVARPLTWVIATDQIDAILAQSVVDLGPALDVSRGDLRWKLSVRDDGSLPMDGVIPSVIQWPDARSPASEMQDLGVTLMSITITTPEPEQCQRALDALGAGDLARVEAGPANLSFTFDTPTGPKRVS